MLEFTIKAKGRSLNDIVDAVKEAGRQIEEGNHMGFNENDTGGYSFDSSGQDDYDYLEEKGWEYDGQGWTKGRMTKPRTYKEALKEEAASEVL